MAANDVFLLDGIIDQRIADELPSTKRDEAFEYFVFEQILKDADMSREEIEAGTVDGRDDGGIDGFFMLANGRPVDDLDNFVSPRRRGELEVLIITCKHQDTFKLAPLDKLATSLLEFLDLGLDDADLKGAYSQTVRDARRKLKAAYKCMAPGLETFHIRVIYASRGDVSALGEAVEAQARNIEHVVSSMFSVCQAECEFVGAAELTRMHRRLRRFNLELPYRQCFGQGDCYAILASLTDFYRFLSDEDGRLRRYLFESNVRDFAGLNRVNDAIAETLRSEAEWDFWWLNNGITVITSRANISRDSIHIDDVQIVNGLQTSESIYNYFRDGGTDPHERMVLVKFIETNDPVVRDEVIRATNTQTEVQQASLHATDETQRHIEQALERHGYYYDRRKSYHLNHGRPESQIISVLYAAAAHVSLALKCPYSAMKLKQKFMRSEGRYSTVFSPRFPLEAWAPMIAITRTADQSLVRRRKRGGLANAVRFQKSWRHLLSLITAARLAGTYSFSPRWLAQLDLCVLTDDLFDETWSFIESEVPDESFIGKRIPTRTAVRRVAAAAAAQWRLSCPERVESRPPFDSVPSELDERFLNMVDAALPDQPWRVGVHVEVARKLRCSVGKVSAAIDALIDTGRRNQQVDGVVYDANDTVIARDTERFEHH